MAETTTSRDPEKAAEIPASCVHRESRPRESGCRPCEVCAEIARMIESGEVPY